jgi:SAM-dependent methyltransferase
MESSNAQKNINMIKTYWDNRPCNIKHSSKKVATKEYFNEVDHKRYFIEPHIKEFANFKKWKNKKVLEIGCRIGTDSINFAKYGAQYYGLELSDKSLNLTKKRFKVYNLPGKLYQINAEEKLDFLGMGTFDLVYSFGVIHHSPNPEKIIENAYNLLKEDGVLKIMLYAQNSWKKL